MYCSASATDWIRSACLMWAMGSVFADGIAPQTCARGQRTPIVPHVRPRTKRRDGTRPEHRIRHDGGDNVRTFHDLRLVLSSAKRRNAGRQGELTTSLGKLQVIRESPGLGSKAVPPSVRLSKGHPLASQLCPLRE